MVKQISQFVVIDFAKTVEACTPHPGPLPSRRGGKIKDKIFGKRHRCSLGLAVGIFCLGVIFMASPALAHRVLVFAYTEGDTIHTESKFVGSGPVQQGEVKVEDRRDGRVLLTGATDENGKFSFKIPPAAVAERLDLLIVVGASMGHQGEWLLKADKYLPGTGGKAAAAPEAGVKTASASPGVGSSGGKVGAVEQQALEEALNKVLERQLAPIKEMLSDMSVRRRTFPEIIGGLGYIVGIFGVVAYFMSKKQPRA